MKKVALASVAVVALTLLFGTAVGNAQVRESTHTAGLQIEGMRRNDAQHKRDGDRDHLHRHPVVVVAVPVFTGPAYSSYYLAPTTDAHRTLDGFYYYCAEVAGFYPAVQDCPSGWVLVP